MAGVNMRLEVGAIRCVAVILAILAHDTWLGPQTDFCRLLGSSTGTRQQRCEPVLLPAHDQRLIGGFQWSYVLKVSRFNDAALITVPTPLVRVLSRCLLSTPTGRTTSQPRCVRFRGVKDRTTHVLFYLERRRPLVLPARCAALPPGHVR